MSGGATAVMAAAAVAGVAMTYMNGQEAKKGQAAAMAQAKDAALKQEQAADQANNRANQKSPDTTAIMSAAQQAGKAGASGTMLTGPTGVDQSQLSLGKSTLLGS